MPAVSTTLKQKLSNLSLSQSASASSASASSSTSTSSPSSFRNVFNLARKGLGDKLTGNNSEPIYDNRSSYIDDESLDEIMQRVIRQAGVDYETRPMVVITAAEFPDPRVLSYDMLFQRVLRHLDLYVESDYTVVFLVAGGKYAPGWSWVWKAYRSLNRKYRKNLKKLYIVHTTVFSKMLFSLAGTIISPKFFRKIQYIPNLSALAQCVPLTNLDLHPAVYRENLKHERQIMVPGRQASSQMFGVPLEKLMGEDGLSSGLPRVIKDCADYIRQQGLDSEGLFRRSPNSAMLRHAKEAYDRGQPVSLPSFGDPHIAAVLIKKFFRDLPQPVFPESMYGIITSCPPPSSDEREYVEYIRTSIVPMLESMSPPTLIVLSYVLHLLHDVSIRSATNKMDATNLALCFTPNLVSGSNIIRDTQLCAIPEYSMTSSINSLIPTAAKGSMTLGVVIKVCIEQYFEIFEEIPDRTTARSIPSTHPSFSFPGSIPSNGSTSTYYGTPMDGSTLVDRDSSRLKSPPPRSSSHSATPERRNVTSPPPRVLSPSASLSDSGHSFTTAEDSDEDEDEAVLVMPIGPSSPTTSSSSHHSHTYGNEAVSPAPPSSWNGPSAPASAPATVSRSNPSQMGIGHPSSPLSHRRKTSALSGTSSNNTTKARSTFESSRGTIRPARSVISIDTGSPRTSSAGYSPGGSIRIGRGGAEGTRRASGAGVEAIGITASGFFSPLNEGGVANAGAPSPRGSEDSTGRTR